MTLTKPETAKVFQGQNVHYSQRRETENGEEKGVFAKRGYWAGPEMSHIRDSRTR